MTTKVLAQHPDPNKQGVNIDKKKYEVIKNAIISILRDQQGIAHFELDNRVKSLLKDSFEGSISWYVATVKLDLEARGTLEINRKVSPQRISLRLI